MSHDECAPADRPTPGTTAGASRWRRARELTGRDWLDLAAAWLLLALLVPALRVVSFDRLNRFLLRLRPVAAVPSHDRSEPARLARLVGVAARHHPLSPTCLPRAMTLRWRLAARGIPATLEIGVRRDSPAGGGRGRLAAHAWIEHAGEVVGERAEIPTDFARLRPIRGPR